MPETGFRHLTAEDVTLTIDPGSFGFRTTAELEPLSEIVAQPRAQRALDLGTGIRHPNYHIYVAGLVGTSRAELIADALRRRISDHSIPPDWVYVNNFSEPDSPLAFRLPAGQGALLRADVEALIEQLKVSIPRAFKEEDFGKERERLRRVYRQKGEEVFERLAELGTAHGMQVSQLPDGEIVFVPLQEGRPMTPEEVEQLTPEQVDELDSHQDELMEMAGRVLQEQAAIQQELFSDVGEVARGFARHLVAPLVEKLKARFEHPELSRWLEQFQEHVLDHLSLFRDIHDLVPRLAERSDEESGSEAEQRFLDYQVNLFIDNSQCEEPPIVSENLPNYRNLFGTIERVVDREGRVITNFTRIKAGSLHRANGGYLILDLMDALEEPFVWKELKRALKARSLQIQVQDPFSLFTVSALQPQPIPLSVRLVAMGEPLIYHLLYLHDEDFREIFRVKADFDPEMPRDAETGLIYGRLVRHLSGKEELLPFNASAVAELVTVGARLAGDQKKVTSVFSHVADVAREASFWAGRAGATEVTAEHVRAAVEERVFRSDLIAEKIRDSIRDGSQLLRLQGRQVGQVNGLAVADIGDYAFGRPSRLTASVGVGTAGILNIERESRMSGRTFDKGMLILEGLLRNYYAREQALALSASIAMEQSYGGVDGDSASVAELLCLLSALAEVPLRQDIAVTGSINQWGEVQAIGGVNEKIEGFYDACRQFGLTGTQGVCIPESNVQNLVLRSDVVAAIREERFHVWAVSTVDQAIELFTGLPAGKLADSQSFHGRVQQRLQQITSLLRQKKTTDTGRVLWIPGDPAGLPSDPRPPLPGQD